MHTLRILMGCAISIKQEEVKKAVRSFLNAAFQNTGQAMKLETKRRWMASIVFGILANFLSIIISGLFTLSLFLEVLLEPDHSLLIREIPSLLVNGYIFFYTMALIFSFPMMIIVTFGSYFRFWITNDNLIDRSWKNPKLK
jgi:hypothetical protein